jgi:hypothetical protein
MMELVRSATELADALRSSDLVLNSPDSLQVAAPAYTPQLAAQFPSIQWLGHLLNEINMRSGAKIQFIRRDSKDPEVLPPSLRFDYESRILLTGRDSSGAGGTKGGVLLMELYEPAGESPVFVKRIRLAEREERAEDSRDGEKAAETVRDRNASGSDRQTENDRRIVSASAINSSQSVNDSVRRRYEDESMVRKVPFGRIEFKEKKVARRLAVLSEATQRLSDGRIQVRLVMVSRKKSQDVDILATFVDDRGQKLAKPEKKDYEFEEGQPRTVVFRSRQPAAGFLMQIEDD